MRRGSILVRRGLCRIRHKPRYGPGGRSPCRVAARADRVVPGQRGLAVVNRLDMIRGRSGRGNLRRVFRFSEGGPMSGPTGAHVFGTLQSLVPGFLLARGRIGAVRASGTFRGKPPALTM